jgi:beta-galactosidase
VKPIYVVAADVARVELRLNGRLLGSVEASASNPNGSRALPAGAKPAAGVTGEPDIPAGQSNDFLFTFPDIKFEPGTLEATGYDLAGHPVTSAKLHTAGIPVALHLTPHIGPAGLHADGADLALVDVEAVDADGQRCPTANLPVSFTVTGPVEWRGGIAQPPAGVSAATFDNYILDKSLPLENGVNRVLLRSRTLAAGVDTGTIKLEATSPGIKSAFLSLNSTAVEVKDGLSNVDPAAGLPSYLERGPTPDGPPLRTVRTSIEVAGATAGANKDQAALSVDGNETTSWSNDGQLSTAWIEYKLAGDAIPNQMDIKLNGFRTRRYPIRVTLGDQLLYEGTTPTSLGYVTVPFSALSRHPRAGTIRITLTAPPIDTGQTSGTAEITGKYDGAGVKPITHDDKARFHVIEVDFYR